MSYMNWRQLMWHAVSHYDLDALTDLLAVPEIQADLRCGEQEWVAEEAPLHLAAYSGYNDIIELLVANNVDIDSYNWYAPDDDIGASGGRITPLHYAVYKNKVSTVQLLLSLGADPRLNGVWGDCKGTPKQFAQIRYHSKIIRILNEAESKEDLEDSSDYDDDDVNKDEAFDANKFRRAINEKERTRQELLTHADNLSKEIKGLKARLERSLPLHEVLHGSCSITETVEDDNPPPTCPVCMSVPQRKIFCCPVCDVTMCNACQSKVEVCPCCRAEFKRGRPRRNKWAEKLVEKNKKEN